MGLCDCLILCYRLILGVWWLCTVRAVSGGVAVSLMVVYDILAGFLLVFGLFWQEPTNFFGTLPLCSKVGFGACITLLFP